MSDAATVFAIYRFRPDVADETIADLLSRHRDVLVEGGLVTDRLPTVVRSLRNDGQHRDFIEIFEWKSADAPGAAHSDPGVRQIWQEFEGLTSAPSISLAQLAEATQPFAHFAPFTVTYASQKATIRPKPKAKPAPARSKVATRRPAPKVKRPAAKAKRPAPPAPKAKRPPPAAKAGSRRRAAGRR